ncbi:MAG TPA: MCP four helix bundle domain-containing protein [Candidatus Acidoferrales bacterium]|nr:MCP four helix bundle domain-containing protein [Candidatus Acidoferrales bacterium]
MARPAEVLSLHSRHVLVAGFGGLLLLMAFAGLDSVRSLREIQAANDNIREDFLLRTRLLERIRGDVYVSGTYVRDYLLEPESGKAEGHRYSLRESRKDMDAALGEYRTLLNAREAGPFHVLTQELDAYWRVLEPVFQWTTSQRQRDGYLFLRDEVFPRRMAMLGIADQIRAINESQLNDGKVRVAAIFTTFRGRLGIAIGLTIGLGLLLAAFSVRKILALETETARHFTEIATARAELQQLSARLLEAQENERRSISRELHDEVGQALTGVLVEMANLSTLIRTANNDAVAAKADEIKKQVEGSISVVRNMALLLRPSMLDDLGLVPALQWQAREVSKRGGLWVKVDADQVAEDLPEDHKTCVYRIVQEALHNCVQHSGAHNVNIQVRQGSGELRLTVEDDGRGFDARQVRGMGLLGMEERVGYLDGRLAVESAPGRGTLLRVTLPLAGKQPA